MRKALAVIGILFLVGAGFWLSYRIGQRSRLICPTINSAPKVDTLTIQDTIIVVEPTEVAVRVSDTILVQVRDTITVRDTCWLQLPRETKIYGDANKTFKAVVSGYQPTLDSIRFYPVETIITVEKPVVQPPKRWGIGVQAGVGYFGKVTPYVGLGISYNFIQF